MISYLKYLFLTAFSMTPPFLSMEENVKRKQNLIKNICMRFSRNPSLAQGKFLTTKDLETRKNKVRTWFLKK